MKRLFNKLKGFIKDDGLGVVGLFVTFVVITGTLLVFEMGYVSYVIGFFFWLFYVLFNFLTYHK